MKKLVRKDSSDWFGGVCLGLAEYWNIDVTVLRLIFLFLFFFSTGNIVWIYIILWAAIPSESELR